MSDWPGVSEAAPYVWAGGAGLLGRAMYHARQVQRGASKPISWTLLWDFPIAFGMGWTAYGACIWKGLTPEPTVSLIIMAAYLGPYSIDRVFAWIGSKYFKEGASS